VNDNQRVICQSLILFIRARPVTKGDSDKMNKPYRQHKSSIVQTLEHIIIPAVNIVYYANDGIVSELYKIAMNIHR